MKIFWDTNFFIYLWEATGELFEMANKLNDRVSSQGDALVTSTLASAELQVSPRKSGDETLALRYKNAIKSSATVVPFDQDAADKFVFVRQKIIARNADAIHLACAAAHGVDLFVTKDDKLQGLRIPGIQFVVSIHTALKLLP